VAAVFALLAGRFWHPHYGFTKFVQLDEADARTGIPEIRAYPVFTYEGFHGYDGAAYAQIAFHPLLDSPALPGAIDSLPYRARRILGSALAWLLAGGRPDRIASTYAALNLGVWFVFAALLWRVLGVADFRGWLAWTGVVLSAGALHSVRLALTDLLAATLLTAAIHGEERGRGRSALGLLALAGLARETALAGVVALWRGPWQARSAWGGNLLRSGLAALPLLGWVIYVHWRIGPAGQGWGNLTWPVAGWIEKWAEIAGDYVRHPQFTWLITTTLLATCALTVQGAYLVRRPSWDDRWWRVGATGVAMLLCLGTSVWEGHPGAATRILLPLGVAFAVLAVRARAHAGWIAAGGLTVFSGVLALWHVPAGARELAAGNSRGGTYLARIDGGFYGIEQSRGSLWTWAANQGTLQVTTFPPASAPLHLRLRVRGMSPREIEVRHGETTAFRGPIPTRPTWIDLPPLTPAAGGVLRLEVRSAAAPVRESEQRDARLLGFAVSGVEVK
jgi:hypothetical protein